MSKMASHIYLSTIHQNLRIRARKYRFVYHHERYILFHGYHNRILKEIQIKNNDILDDRIKIFYLKLLQTSASKTQACRVPYVLTIIQFLKFQNLKFVLLYILSYTIDTSQGLKFEIILVN